MTDILSAPLVLAFSRALLQFVWQGGAIALAAFAITRGFRLSARGRHDVGVFALTSMLVALVGTTWYNATVGQAAAAGTIAGDNASAFLSSSTASVTSPTNPGGAAAPGRLSSATAPVVLFWSMGVVLFSVRLAGAWVAARRLARRAAVLAAPEIQLVARRLAAHLALDRVVRVAQASSVRVPMMIGWIKPVVILPVAAIGGLSPLQLEAILAHELAHVLRQDYLVNLLQSIAETVLFYHPAVWWVSKDVRAAREQACDDLALGVCDSPRVCHRARGFGRDDGRAATHAGRHRRFARRSRPPDSWTRRSRDPPARRVASCDARRARGSGDWSTRDDSRRACASGCDASRARKYAADGSKHRSHKPSGRSGHGRTRAGCLGESLEECLQESLAAFRLECRPRNRLKPRTPAEKERRDLLADDMARRLAKSEIDLIRLKQLSEKGLVSQRELDTATAEIARLQELLKSAEEDRARDVMRSVQQLERLRELVNKGLVAQDEVAKAEIDLVQTRANAARLDQELKARPKEIPRTISPESAALRDRLLKPMSDDLLTAALKDAARITSDVDRAEVLIAAAKGQTLTTDMVLLFVKVASGIQSVDEKNRVFAQPVRLRPAGGR